MPGAVHSARGPRVKPTLHVHFVRLASSPPREHPDNHPSSLTPSHQEKLGPEIKGVADYEFLRMWSRKLHLQGLPNTELVKTLTE